MELRKRGCCFILSPITLVTVHFREPDAAAPACSSGETSIGRVRDPGQDRHVTVTNTGTKQALSPGLSLTGMTHRQQRRWGTGSPGDVTEATSWLVSKCKLFMSIPTWEENLLQHYCFSILQWIKQQTANLSAFYLHSSQSARNLSQRLKKIIWTPRNWIKQGIKHR